MKKRNFPIAKIRRFLEPGPIVLVSSCWRGRTNIMTHGWHTVMEFTPSLVGSIISDDSHSFKMIRRSRECVINIPTVDLATTVVGIGNTTGAEIDKFEVFGLTAAPATKVKAPLIAEVSAHYALPRRWRVHDLGRKYESVSPSLSSRNVVRPHIGDSLTQHCHPERSEGSALFQRRPF